MLEHCRALDLSDEKGLLCGKILADLGVDVIKVEPPSGDKVGNIGPFYRNIPDSEIRQRREVFYSALQET